MKRKFIIISLLVCCLMPCLYLKKESYIKPFQFILGNSKQYGPWSIGIYKGKTPFSLIPASNLDNPILTGEKINDIDAQFVADPFLIIEKEKKYIFFEVFNRKSNQGDIALAESIDGINWKYQGIVLNESFHLSYPHVFKWGNEYYMIPESYDDLSVRLYKSKNFPFEWTYITTLLSGYEFVDPTIFRHNDQWWMFVSTPNCDVLNLYFSKHLNYGWKPHPLNPIVKRNKHIARPAGKVFNFNGNKYRLAQDDDPYYGIQVFAFEIIELNEKSYKEKQASKKPLVTRSDRR